MRRWSQLHSKVNDDDENDDDDVGDDHDDEIDGDDDGDDHNDDESDEDESMMTMMTSIPRDLIEKKECGKPPGNPCADRSRPVCRSFFVSHPPDSKFVEKCEFLGPRGPHGIPSLVR